MKVYVFRLLSRICCAGTFCTIPCMLWYLLGDCEWGRDEELQGPEGSSWSNDGEPGSSAAALPTGMCENLPIFYGQSVFTCYQRIKYGVAIHGRYGGIKTAPFLSRLGLKFKNEVE